MRPSRLVTLFSILVVAADLLLPASAIASGDRSSTRATQATETTQSAPKAKKPRPDSAAGHAVVRKVAAGIGNQKAHPDRETPTRKLKAPASTKPGKGAPKKAVQLKEGQASSSTRSGLSAQTTESSAPQPNAPISGGSFLGMNEVGSIPPDPTMAAGRYQVAIATNDGYRAFSKTGTPVPNTVAQPCAGSCSLGAFFTNAVAGTNIFDPWLVYDQYIHRFWFLVVSQADSPKNSDFLLGLSNSDDVRDGWSLFRIDARTNGNDVQDQWCDYEKLGVDAQAIYLTCNMFEFPSDTGDFQYSKIRAMTKGQFLNNTCCLWYDWWNLREGLLGVYASFTIQPAHMYGASAGDGEYLINAFSTCVFCPPDELRVRHITNVQVCCVPGNQQEPDMDEETQGVGNMPDPPTASQQGTATGIDAGDHRLLFAVWQNGRLSTGQTIECPDVNDACAAFTELDVSDFGDIGTVNDWYFGGDGSDRYYPAVDTNAAGNKTMVYTRSSSSEFAGAHYIGIPNSGSCTGCLDGPETELKAGENSYVDFGSPPGSRNRWGDYLGASADPDGTGIWIHGEWAQSTMNLWSTQVGLTYELRDLTPPVTTASLSPAPTIYGWNNTDVLVTLTATDAGSGVRRITYSASGAQTIGTTVVNGATASFTVSTQGITTVSFFAEDNWGNVESTKTQVVRIDKVAPSVSCGTADGAWHATDVTITCTASDSLSGLADSSDASFGLTTTVPVETEPSDACTGTHNVFDRAGNFTTAGPVCGNMIDKKAPTISITTPASGAIYILNQPVPASYSCLDGGSGLKTCAGPVASGVNIDTLSVGNKTFTVNATDNVDNARSASVNYIVTYKICLQYDPTRPFSGNSVPIRLYLCDYFNVNVSAPGIILHATVVNPGLITPTSSANPTNDFLFNSGLGGYTYVLNVSGYAPGSYTLAFTVTGDPIVHTAPFRLR